VLRKGDSRAGRVAQVVGHLPSKCEAISSNPSATNKKRKRERERERENPKIHLSNGQR
jgi:hypothetical protein